MPTKHESDKNTSDSLNENSGENDSENSKMINIDEKAEKLAKNAKGTTVDSDKLTTSGHGILTSGYLYDQPVITYLNENEQPHYLFFNNTKGIKIGGERKVGGFLGYRHLMLVTNKGVRFFAGSRNGDFHEFLLYDWINNVEVDKHNTLYIKTRATKYKFQINTSKLHEAEIEDAVRYIKKQMNPPGSNQEITLENNKDQIDEDINEREPSSHENLEIEDNTNYAPPDSDDKSFEEQKQPDEARTSLNQAEQLKQEKKTNFKTETKQPESSVPDTFPSSPDLSVDYDMLTGEEPIGGGGNADVSKATLSMSGTEVTLAIKEPRMSGTLHTDQVDQILQEAEIWNRLDNHDHIVGVVDYDSDPLPWIAMEYMDGGHLGERSSEMALPQALWTATAITRGVRYAHVNGVAHLDLNPSNILFRSIEDGWDIPKVADWGLSKHLLDHSNSVEGLSPQYAAPEQFDDEYGSTDNITDIYQLGAVFYELFTGQPPFDGKPFEIIGKVKNESPTAPSEIADVPNKLDDILLTALAKQKDNRYEDILYLRDDLESLFKSVADGSKCETTADGGTDDDSVNDDYSDDDTNGDTSDSSSITGKADLPVSRNVHRDLVTVVETAPNRAWINEYFDWVATLLNATDLDKHDDRLVTAIRTDQNSLPITVSWRYCLKGFPSEGKVAAILPADSAAINDLEAEATYTERFSGNSSRPPYYYQLPSSAGDFFLEEFEEDWLRAVKNQCEIDRNAKNPDAHEPAVCIAALNSTYRTKVLDDAF